MDRENFEFLNELTKEQKSDLSKAVRDMVTRGRVFLGVERYKKGEASLGQSGRARRRPRGPNDDTPDRVWSGKQNRR
jgi:hypothetical protein